MTTPSPSTPPSGSPSGLPYRWATLTTEDVSAWADLVNHLATVDGTEEFYQEEDLAEELGASGFDPELDSVAVWAGSTMVAFGQVSVPTTTDHEGAGRGYVTGGVRQEHRGKGLGRALMDRLEPRAEHLVAQRHPTAATTYLRSSGGLVGSGAQSLLEHRGYRVVRYFNELERPVGGDVEVPSVEGVSLISPTDEHQEACRLAHNDAFRDHWGSGPVSEERWHDLWNARARRAEPSTIAVDGEGRVLAYVMCSEWVERDLYVDILGTVRESRGRGLAQAALLRTIDLAGRSGDYDRIELGVDSANPSGATALYEKVGFTHKLQTTSLQRDLTAT